MLTLWRNTRIATCNERADVHSAGAVFTRDGMIEWVGDETELPAGLRPERTVELAGRWLTPGLIDCHTHLVFAGQRAAEFARRTSGTSYAEIAREGGGILGTMRATRAATEEALFEQSRPRLESLLQEGVTTVEIKSGYGLDLETEKKMLRVARRLGAGHPVTISTSFLAAHALPPEFSGRPDEYIDTICRDWLPEVARRSRRLRRRLLREHRLFRRAVRSTLRRSPRSWACPSGCTRSSCRTSAAARSPRGTARCPATISNTRTSRTPSRSHAAARWP